MRARVTSRSQPGNPVLEPLFRAVRANHPKADLALRYDLTVPLARYVAEHEHDLRLQKYFGGRGNELLTVTGRVINPTSKEQSVPPLQAQLRSRGGKVVNVTTTTAGADGKLSIVSEDKQQASTMTYSAVRT